MTRIILVVALFLIACHNNASDKLERSLQTNGSLGSASTFEELTREFNDLDDYIKIFQERTFNIREMLNE